jgi:hypothetical protein
MGRTLARLRVLERILWAIAGGVRASSPASGRRFARSAIVSAEALRFRPFPAQWKRQVPGAANGLAERASLMSLVVTA